MPKSKPEDFYDREVELKDFIKQVKVGRKLILILGLRRSGKTSLLETGLGLTKFPYVVVDVREMARFPKASYSDFLRILERSIQKLMKRPALVDFLKRIRGVRIHGFEIAFERGKGKLDVGELFEALDSWAGKSGKKVVVAFDEAQLLTRVVAWRPQMLLAHAYDYLKNTTFVLTGSEVGLLYDFLGVDDPEAPLYGRHRVEIKLERFSEEKSRDFLSVGFEQASVKAPKSVIDCAVKTLDGIVGWLTEFGAKAMRKGAKREVVDEVLRDGSKLAIQEIEHFLNVRAIARGRYMVILEKLAGGASSWSELKRFVEREKGPIYSKNFTDLLNNLVKAGFVEQREGLYAISDPVLLHALRR